MCRIRGQVITFGRRNNIMGFALIRVFLMFNAFGITTEYPLASTYRFKVYPVDKCPMNKSQFEEAAIRWNCSRDTRYLCAPDRNLSNLIEFCTDVRRSLFGPDNCVRLEGTGNLNHYGCKEFSSGCPSTPYFDDEIYKYPACLFINRDSNCFIADINCQDRPFNTTTIGMCLDNSNEDLGSKMKTNTSETLPNTNNVIIFVVYAFVTTMIGIIGIASYKRLKKNKDKTKIQMDEKKFKDFLSKGELTVRHVRCIIVGCSGAGKTTLLKRLLNAKFKDLKNIKTTELVDVHVNIFEVLENEATIQSVNTKKKIPSITFPKKLFERNDTTTQVVGAPFIDDSLTKERGQSEFEDNAIKSSYINKFENVDESVNKETEWIDSSINATEQEKLIQPAPSYMLINKEEKTHQILEENRSDTKTNPFLDNSEKYAFSKIMDAVKDLSNEKHLCPRITFLDFAGQSMYYAFHQIYLSSKTCYILVVDMTKSPNEQVLETDESCCSIFKSWTYKDYYKFWLKSIDSYGDTNSPVILVGTYAENFSKQDSENFFREFFALFEHHHDIQRHLHKNRCFAIGFPDKWSKLADLKEIKTCIASIVNYWGYSEEIQPVWAIFEHIMQEEKGRRIISRKNISDYNESLDRDYRLNDNNITEMLLFMHTVGSLLYFDIGILKDTIILDVQWFVNAFKCIIAYHENIAITDRNSSRFKTTGEITDRELTTIWENNEEGQTYISHKKEILLYMEQLGLLAICNSQTGEALFYYIPSMNKRKFKNLDNNFEKSSILCFQFNENAQLPFNIFYRLVVNCRKIPEWSILQENYQNCWYENVACFSYRHCIVVVCICKFQIQLQVWITEKNRDIDLELLGDIQRSIEDKISENKKYTYEIGYKCKNGMLNVEEDSHFIKQRQFPVSKLHCPNCALENKHYIDNNICWVQSGQQKYRGSTLKSHGAMSNTSMEKQDSLSKKQKSELNDREPLAVSFEPQSDPVTEEHGTLTQRLINPLSGKGQSNKEAANKMQAADDGKRQAMKIRVTEIPDTACVKSAIYSNVYLQEARKYNSNPWSIERRKVLEQLMNAREFIKREARIQSFANISYSSVGLSGGGLTIAGIIAAPFTFGAYLGLTIAGMTSSGSSEIASGAIRFLIEKTKLNNAKESLYEHSKSCKEMKRLLEAFQNNLKNDAKDAKNGVMKLSVEDCSVLEAVGIIIDMQSLMESSESLKNNSTQLCEQEEKLANVINKMQNEYDVLYKFFS